MPAASVATPTDLTLPMKKTKSLGLSLLPASLVSTDECLLLALPLFLAHPPRLDSPKTVRSWFLQSKASMQTRREPALRASRLHGLIVVILCDTGRLLFEQFWRVSKGTTAVENIYSPPKLTHDGLLHGWILGQGQSALNGIFHQILSGKIPPSMTVHACQLSSMSFPHLDDGRPS